MSRLSTAHVFVDANTALHFKRPDQIDWCTLADANEVVLVGAPILLRELEHQKVVNRSRKLRERATDYIKWLHPFVRNPESEVRPGVKWVFIPDEPPIDFSAERLSETISDDHLIASVLHYTRQSNIDAFVATADLGLEVKLWAREIRVLEFSDDLRLPAQLDPLEQENKNLRLQIARIESRMPKLSVAFEDDTQHHALSIQAADHLIPPSLENVQAENPYMSKPGRVADPQDRVTSTFGDIRRLTQQFGVSAELVDTFNEELERYFLKYQDYLDHHAEWREAICLHYLVKFVVANEGTAPANNVDLDLFFPEETAPVDEDDYPKEPKAPKPPRRPQGIMNPRDFGNADYLSSLLPPNLYPTINPNYDGVPIISENKNLVRIGYSSLKHGFDFTSEELVFRFASLNTIQAFSVGYRLSADELPDALEGQLHFYVE